MKKLIAICFILSTIILFTECKKYPEGPSISLRSKKERIANDWKIEKYYENDVDKTSDFNSIFTKFIFTTTKGGSYTIERLIYSTVTVIEKGSWTLESNKKTFLLNPTSISVGTLPEKSSWQILKLYENSMWLRGIDSNGKKIEYHLIP